MDAEFRVARSTVGDDTFNTLDLRRALTFAVLEFLDDSDSKFFAQKLRGNRWRDVTPDRIRNRRTYYATAPEPGEIEELADISPDWFYLSGHYGRTYAPGDESRLLMALPGGLFNEPFHVKEWKNAWSATAPNSAYLQLERFIDDPAATVYLDYMTRQTMLPPSAAFPLQDSRSIAELAVEWAKVWKTPGEDVVVSGQTYRGTRGFFLAHRWENVKALILISCNVVAWGKTALREAFPNAIFLGYVGKNPANATPHVRAFLDNAFRGIKDPSDPILLNHAHLGRAWLDVHHRQRAYQSDRLAYLLPDGNVYGAGGSRDNPKVLGTAEDLLVPLTKNNVERRRHVFGIKEGKVLEPVPEP